MWIHTTKCHDSQIGPDKGLNDYKFIVTGRFQTNLHREIDEGRRQSVFEEYQTNKKLIVLNSKIDFIQPLRTQLVAYSKNINNKPGQINASPAKTKGKRQPKRRLETNYYQSTPKKRKIMTRDPSLSPIYVNQQEVDTFLKNIKINHIVQ